MGQFGFFGANKKSKVESHVFGAQENAPEGRIIRTIGQMRARAKIGLQNLVYDVRRFVILERPPHGGRTKPSRSTAHQA